ncbi:GH3 auxin-responsive promoter family protein [Alkaliflexus imshenetskii]|uniref:GH3 auxin-responsive promoter family protein n=1 Tax=Alkaliflexus imshenetskii TaxID=286730 RepID=UPI000478BBE4|nr:GH3 auxin-responsive promoter family protein [Alkaliflexus imshenetskii]
MPIINDIFSLFNARRGTEIEYFRQNAGAVQEKQFRNLIDRAKSTVYGKQHDFESIRSVNAFKERVPVQDYEGLMPHIIRLRQGEKNLLWPGEIKWFAKSSGTTSAKSKFIPISREALNDCHYQGGRDTLVIYNQLIPDSNLFSGKTLTLGGSHQINSFSNDSVYGDLSAILIENLPFWTNFVRTPGREIALLDEWEKKLQLITETTIKENVTALAGVPSWFLVLLKNVLAYTGKKDLLEVWPNLELFIHGGVSFVPYRQQYQELIPSQSMHYLETYNASEGFFAIQDDFSSPGLLLMLDYGVFYEFMPLSELGNPYPKTYTIEETDTETDYALIISTNGGLWRYLIGDTVRFVSKKPYKIIITGRTKHFINAFGEELMIENAEKALQVACNATGAIIKEYTAAPVYMGSDAKGAHQWLIEFANHPDDFGKFTNHLDNALKEVNSDYEAKRYKDMTLVMPEVIIARDNLFFDWLKKKKKLGGQNKVPRLANNREYMDDLLKLNL